MVIILEIATIVLALMFCYEQVAQLLAIKKEEKIEKIYNRENYKAGSYNVRK